MADTGLKYATTVTQAGSPSWTNPNNALAKDSNYATNSEAYQYNTVKLVISDSPAGDNLATGAPPLNNPADVTFGGSTNLWGNSLTPSIVNASDFGITIGLSWFSETVSLTFTGFGFNLPSDATINGVVATVTAYYVASRIGGTGYVDSVALTIYYTESAGGDDYTLTCAAGSYSLTGTNADLTVKRNYVLACSAGNYLITGTDATLTVQRNYTLVCEPGSYALTGSDISFVIQRNYSLACEAGSYSLTGTDANLVLLRNYILACEAGSYALTGTDASLTSHRIFALGVGSYVLVGTSVGLFILTPTPACRTATIEFENRTFAIPHENRTATIEFENRTLEVTCH